MILDFFLNYYLSINIFGRLIFENSPTIKCAGVQLFEILLILMKVK